MAALLARLDLVAGAIFAALRRVCGVDDEDLADMLAEIRSLEPKPGRAFAPAAGRRCSCRMSWSASAPDGGFVGRAEPGHPAPRPRQPGPITPEWRRSAQATRTRAFLSDCLQTANWLTRSLDQRARTILKVAAEIVRQQEGFFRHGVSGSAPAEPEDRGRRDRDARIDDLARHLEQGHRHEPRHLRDEVLLHRRDRRRGGGEHSSEAVRHRIRQLIEAESGRKRCCRTRQLSRN